MNLLRIAVASILGLLIVAAAFPLAVTLNVWRAATPMADDQLEWIATWIRKWGRSAE